MAKPQRAAKPGSEGSGRAAGNGRKKKRRGWRILLWSLVGLLGLALIGTGAIAYAYVNVKVPDANSDFRTNTSFVYYSDGKTQIGSFQIQNRQTISYDAMPQQVKDAIVAAENRSFWDDPGISVTGLFRATLGLIGLAPADTTATGGGSTITQQYIKLMYLNQERTFTRKATEILLAAKMGQQMTKQQILEGYLNTVYFGRGAYGIEAAAKVYFNKTAAKLTLAQSVALAAIVNSPSNLDPAKGTQQAADLLERYQYTLNGMVEMGTITATDKAAIYTKLPKFPVQSTDSRLGGQKGFLLTMVKEELAAQGFSDEEINGGGLKVVTTFDTKLQDAVVKTATKMGKAAAGSKKAAQQLHPTIASIDNSTGGIVAIYGGPDFLKSQINWATTARPTGSSFKPYALAAALRQGWTLTDKLNGNPFTPKGDSSPVSNAGGTHYGRVTLQYATTHSINSAYVDLVTKMDDGATSVQQAAEDAGVPKSGHWDLSDRIPLGNSEVSPVNQASAYSTFANLGVHRSAHVVATVTSSSGSSVYKADTDGEQKLESDVAQDVTYALTKVTQDGTGRRVSALGYPVAGKTGTVYYNSKTNGHTKTKTVAAWFVGFTSQITTAVMYVKGKAGTSNLGNSFYGSGYPAMTWLDYMKTAMKGKDKVSFKKATTRESTRTPTATKTTSTATATATSTASATKTATSSATKATSSATTTKATQKATTTSPTSTTTEPTATKTTSTSNVRTDPTGAAAKAGG